MCVAALSPRQAEVSEPHCTPAAHHPLGGCLLTRVSLLWLPGQITINRGLKHTHLFFDSFGVRSTTGFTGLNLSEVLLQTRFPPLPASRGTMSLVHGPFLRPHSSAASSISDSDPPVLRGPCEDTGPPGRIQGHAISGPLIPPLPTEATCLQIP